MCALCPQRWVKANEGPALLKEHSGCSALCALIRELWEGKANRKATAVASILCSLYRQDWKKWYCTLTARGIMLKHFLWDGTAIILISKTFIWFAFFMSYIIYCLYYNVVTHHLASFFLFFSCCVCGHNSQLFFFVFVFFILFSVFKTYTLFSLE